MVDPFVMRATPAFCRGGRVASTDPVVPAFPGLIPANVEEALEKAIVQGQLAGTIRCVPCHDGQTVRITDIRGIRPPGRQAHGRHPKR